MEKALTLAVIAAVLGVSEACQRHDAPAAVREVAPLASTSAAPSAAVVEAALPSASASVSTTASASAAPTAMATSTSQLLRIGAGVGTGCGARASCGATASGPKPTAQIKASIESGVAGDDHIIAALRSRFRACATQGLAQNPNMRGRVVVYVNIAANGSVIDANSRVVGVSQSVADCMIASIKRAQFTASTPRHVSVTIEQTEE